MWQSYNIMVSILGTLNIKNVNESIISLSFPRIT